MWKGKVQVMKLFFDTEFTGLRKTTTLISLGIVAEDGRKFYAEFTDYSREQCDDWIKENVIDNLCLDGMGDGASSTDENQPCILVRGNKEYVKSELSEWLSRFDAVEFVSDVCHYDFVLLIDLFGTAFDLPKNVNPACHDINQDIARHFDISEAEAFNVSREEIVLELYGREIEGRKHNSLYDAEVIKAIYEGIAE